jgi:uncharacterized protein (DUF433 family)
MAEEVIVRSAEVLVGTPVFRGTGVPFQTMIDYLRAGDSIDDFAGDFPSVVREDAIAALDRARDLLVEHVADECPGRRKTSVEELDRFCSTLPLLDDSTPLIREDRESH